MSNQHGDSGGVSGLTSIVTPLIVIRYTDTDVIEIYKHYAKKVCIIRLKIYYLSRNM